MKNQNYEKPQLKFVSLYSEGRVAATCWGHHGDPTYMRWFDSDGAGFISFQIEEGSCSLNLINVKYYDSKNDTDPDPLMPTDEKYKELYDALSNVAGGEEGNPFNDKDNRFPEGPDKPIGWS